MRSILSFARRREACAHRRRAVALVDLLEAVALVQVHRRAVRGDAEADRVIALGPGAREECVHELAAEAVAALARDDGDRQLGRLLVYTLVNGHHPLAAG